jgi:hypothetical protein
MDGALTFKVECYSGSKYTNRPTAVLYNQERLTIGRILAEEYTPNGKRFQIELDDGCPLVLEYRELTDKWIYTGSL